MTIQRTVEHYEENKYFQRHPDIYVLEAEENLWLAEHDHSFLELTLVTEGKGTHYVNGVPLQTERGDLFAIPVGTRHIFRPAARSSRAERGEKLKVLNCLIRAGAISRLSGFLQDEAAQAFLSLMTGSTADKPAWLRIRDDSDELRSLFARLHADYKGSAGSLSLWSGALGLLAAVNRHAEISLGAEEERLAGARNDTSATRALSSLHPAPLSKALACMRRRYAEPLTAAIVAAEAGIGERQLARLFASRTGRTFRSHLEDIRVEACCRLLRDGQAAIMDLPPLVGYEQWKSLSRVFRSRMGISMSEYRSQVQRID